MSSTLSAETEGLETHRFQGDVTGEDHQVGPGNLPAYFRLTGQSSRRALSRFVLSGHC
jgi:hypothetical protein